jgi:hypothetical protein
VNTEECDAVLVTVRDAEWLPATINEAAGRVLDERVRNNGGGDATGVDHPHAALRERQRDRTTSSSLWPDLGRQTTGRQMELCCDT